MIPSEVADEVARLTGRRPGPATIRAWINRGVGGHLLAAQRVGGVWVVTRESLRLFLDAVNRQAVRA